MAALAVAGLARWSGNDLEVDARGQVTALPLGAVVFATVLGVAAAQALRVVSLRTARPRRTYWLLAGLGLIVSSVPPLTAATDTATAAWLLLRTQPLLRCCCQHSRRENPRRPAPQPRDDQHDQISERDGDARSS